MKSNRSYIKSLADSATVRDLNQAYEGISTVRGALHPHVQGPHAAEIIDALRHLDRVGALVGVALPLPRKR